MTVYLVILDVAQTPGDVRGVYFDLDRAKKRCDEHNLDPDRYGEFIVEAWEDGAEQGEEVYPLKSR